MKKEWDIMQVCIVVKRPQKICQELLGKIGDRTVEAAAFYE